MHYRTTLTAFALLASTQTLCAQTIPNPFFPTMGNAMEPTPLTSTASLSNFTMPAPQSPAPQSPAPRPQNAGTRRRNPASGVNFTINTPPPINPINQAPVPLTAPEKRSQNITKDWRNYHAMPTRGRDGAVVFTYGATQPSIVCAPLAVCLLKLEAGEHITKNGEEIGDPTQWSIKPTVTQNEGGLEQTVLVIKPFDSGLRTVMAVITDRRIYSIKLVSVPRQDRAMALAEFYYPQSERHAWDHFDDHPQTPTPAAPKQMVTITPLPARLDFDYALGGDRVNWRPLRIYNDGTRTFIQFPNNVNTSDLPVLTILTASGQKELTNYHKMGNSFVVERLFDQGVLRLGTGHHQRHVTITRQHIAA